MAPLLLLLPSSRLAALFAGTQAHKEQKAEKQMAEGRM
jgi:hypothetical protein